MKKITVEKVAEILTQLMEYGLDVEFDKEELPFEGSIEFEITPKNEILLRLGDKDYQRFRVTIKEEKA